MQTVTLGMHQHWTSAAATPIRVLSPIVSVDEASRERQRGLPRQRIELLRWTQFARRPQLALSDHVHELDAGQGCAADRKDWNPNIGRATRLTAR